MEIICLRRTSYGLVDSKQRFPTIIDRRNYTGAARDCFRWLVVRFYAHGLCGENFLQNTGIRKMTITPFADGETTVSEEIFQQHC